jgi:hypothetical protein
LATGRQLELEPAEAAARDGECPTPSEPPLPEPMRYT